jgi:hypothetical protein
MSRSLNSREMKPQSNHQVWVSRTRDHPSNIPKQWNLCRSRIRNESQQPELRHCHNMWIPASRGQSRCLSNVVKATQKVSFLKVGY